MKHRYIWALLLVLGSCASPSPESEVLTKAEEAQLETAERVETATSQIEVPEADVLEIVVPEIKVPDIVVPDIVVPDVVAPDVVIPDFVAPNVTLPKVTLPEVTLPEITVQQGDDRTVYSLSADILFDFDKADIRPSAAAGLQQISNSIAQQSAEGPITVVGHTDNKGSDSYNLDLSQKRAVSVRQWLIDNAVLEPSRLEIYGAGEAQPVAENTRPDGSDNPAGRQQNRRVEIIVQTVR